MKYSLTDRLPYLAKHLLQKGHPFCSIHHSSIPVQRIPAFFLTLDTQSGNDNLIQYLRIFMHSQVDHLFAFYLHLDTLIANIRELKHRIPRYAHSIISIVISNATIGSSFSMIVTPINGSPVASTIRPVIVFFAALCAGDFFTVELSIDR